MQKISRLYKKLTKTLIVSGAVLLGIILVYALIGSMQDDSLTELKRMRTQLSFKKTEVNTLSNQLDNSKEGEQQFLKYVLARENDHFFMDVQEVKKRLRALQGRFDLSESLKLTLTNPVEITDPALRSLPHTISTINNAKLAFVALSDLHVYSFIQAMQSELPGVIEMTRINIKKRGDLSASTLARISARGKPELVEVELQFNWYSFVSKSEKAERS